MNRLVGFVSVDREEKKWRMVDDERLVQQPFQLIYLTMMSTVTVAVAVVVVEIEDDLMRPF